MIKSERIAGEINEKIKEWASERAKLLVAIDGYAGSGKTTIADCIGKQNPDVLVLHLDDFIKHVDGRKKMMETAEDKPKVFELNWYRYDVLEKLVRRFKEENSGVAEIETYDFDKNDFAPKKPFDLSKKVLIIEGIFLLHPAHAINKLWDKKIYLAADFAEADKKRIAREKKRWGKEYLPEDHPDNWVTHFKSAYKKYAEKYHPEQNADMVVAV